MDDAILKIIDKMSKINQTAYLTPFQIDKAIYKHECEIHNNQTSCKLFKEIEKFIKEKIKEIGV